MGAAAAASPLRASSLSTQCRRGYLNSDLIVIRLQILGHFSLPHSQKGDFLVNLFSNNAFTPYAKSRTSAAKFFFAVPKKLNVFQVIVRWGGSKSLV